MLQVATETDDDFFFLAWPVRVVHHIDETSPLWELSPEALLMAGLEIIVILEACCEATGSTTQVPHVIHYQLFGSGNGSPSATIRDFLMIVRYINFRLPLIIIIKPTLLLLLLLLLLFLGLLLLSDFQSTKAFSFHCRATLNLAHRLVTIFSTIAPCRIFKLSPN